MKTPIGKNPHATSDKETKRRLNAIEATKTKERPDGSLVEAAKILGNVSANALSRWIRLRNLSVGRHSLFSKEICIEKLREIIKRLGRLPTREELKETDLRTTWRTHWNNIGKFFEAAGVSSGSVDRAKFVKFLRGAPTLENLAWKTGLTRGQVLDYCDRLKTEGLTIIERGDRVAIETTPVQVAYDENLHLYESDKSGKYRFGVISDNHLCSKYAREDILQDLYDWYAREGVKRIYNAGNWIDGEAYFNRHDLLVYGQDQQLSYWATHYPQREGIVTYYVAGDDHEGWYAKGEGIDIGKRAQQTAENLGRRDLRYIGYMEAFITLRHAVNGRESRLMIVHPGGGAAYALSYSAQKHVEVLQGGEKPAVVVYGHWHKMGCFNYRNVWILLAGTTQDQTPFMRKLKIDAHVGGMIVELEQDEQGAIVMCKPEMKRYFDRGYYNNRFNMGGDVFRPNVQK